MASIDDKAPSPDVPPGWYPDSSQTATQRYWDGTDWTDQRAPLPPKPLPSNASWSLDLTPRLVLALLGTIACVVSIFLPHAESQGVLTIVQNTFISNSDGIIIVILALAGAAVAIRDAAKPKISVLLGLLGGVLIGLAFFEGGSEQIKVVNGLGQEVPASAGPAVYVLGLGGVLMLLAAFARGKAPPPQDI